MLTQVFDKEKTQSIIDVMPDEMVVWKVVTGPDCPTAMGDGWHSYYYHADTLTPYIKGVIANYGYHSYISENAANKFLDTVYKLGEYYTEAIVSAKILKKDIKNMGYEDNGTICVVTSRIIMPTYPNTDITKELNQAPQLVEECDRAMELMLT